VPGGTHRMRVAYFPKTCRSPRNGASRRTHRPRVWGISVLPLGTETPARGPSHTGGQRLPTILSQGRTTQDIKAADLILDFFSHHPPPRRTRSPSRPTIRGSRLQTRMQTYGTSRPWTGRHERLAGHRETAGQLDWTARARTGRYRARNIRAGKWDRRLPLSPPGRPPAAAAGAEPGFVVTTAPSGRPMADFPSPPSSRFAPEYEAGWMRGRRTQFSSASSEVIT
jgi:hypothetical protein